MSAHVMLDLETWGIAPGSALRSIGAVLFDPRGGCISSLEPHEFYANIDRASCEFAGLAIDPATVRWWRRQPQEAQDALLAEAKPLHIVAMQFHEWWRLVRGRYLWSNGANFDEPLWRAACSAVGLRVPWAYWDVRDTRTAWDLAGVDARMVRRGGVAHNALDDARHQAHCVVLAYRRLGLGCL